MQSIEHTLRALDRMAEKEQERAGHLQKTLADFQGQAGRPFEHETRLKELLARQAELNEVLDLDKGERQVAATADDGENGGSDSGDARQPTHGNERRYRPNRQAYAEAEEPDELEAEYRPRPGRAPGRGM
jgi:hypothetical protein